MGYGRGYACRANWARRRIPLGRCTRERRSGQWCFGKICDGWNERRGSKANVQVVVFQLFSCLAWISVSAGIRIRLGRWAEDGRSRVARRLNGEMTDDKKRLVGEIT